VNGTSEEVPPGAVPTAGPALDDDALGGAGSLRHGAVVYGSDDGLLEVALPFLEEGLDAGDLTVLSCAAATVTLLRDALGGAGRALESDAGLTPRDTRPPDVFTHLRQYAHRAAQGGTGRLRVLAEVPAADDARQVRELVRLEAVVNSVMAELPITNLCAYDTRRLDPGFVASATRTHPEVVTGAGWTANGTYLGPEAVVRGLPAIREPLEETEPLVAVDAAPTLPELRHRLTGALPALVGDEEQLEDLKLGISEVAANAFRHGSRPVSGRLWSDGRRVVCRITDSGTSFDDPMAGFIPAHGFDLGRGGMGLWLARKLFDHVDLFVHAAGFSVRLSTALR
jgi:anti-sigma regulatory factor (Ser/Thr protein kinase)